MRRDRRSDARRGAAHEPHGLPRRNVFEHDAQPRMAPEQRSENPVEKDLLPIEDVHLGKGHFAMHQQRQIHVLHRLERPSTAGEIGDAGIRVGRRAGRVILHTVHNTALLRTLDLLGRGVVREIERHEGHESVVGRQRRDDAPAIRNGHVRGRDRRREIRHHDRAPEPPRAIGHDRRHFLVVPQVKVAIVRTADGEAGHACLSRTSSRAALPAPCARARPRLGANRRAEAPEVAAHSTSSGTPFANPQPRRPRSAIRRADPSSPAHARKAACDLCPRSRRRGRPPA